MVKGTKLDVAFLNMSINTWFTHYLPIIFPLLGIKMRINLISECLCTVVFHLICMQILLLYIGLLMKVKQMK